MQRHDDLDKYTVDIDSDDPFASPPPETRKKRKEPDGAGLGIDRAVAVQKRARVPTVKLDDEKLLGPLGIPKLKARAAGLKLKGKGHEFSDAARLLSFYQLWLDDLFPKARFLDALSMVEKAGHKKKLQAARQEWINQGKPRHDDDDNNVSDPDNDGNGSGNGHDAQAPGTPKRATQREDPDDDDLYDATPRASRTRPAPAEDDLEALMAEAELLDAPRGMDTASAAANSNSRNSSNNNKDFSTNDDDEDLDALIAEAEAQDRNASRPREVDGDPPDAQDDFADDEDAMREMEGW